jgi:hypothetical protein
MLEVPDAAVYKLEVIRRRGVGKIVPVNYRHRVASQSGAPRNAGTEHSSPDYKNIEPVVGKFFAPVLHRVSTRMMSNT